MHLLPADVLILFLFASGASPSVTNNFFYLFWSALMLYSQNTLDT